MRRLFIAVDLPDDLREALRIFSARSEWAALRVRWAPSALMHLTLFFLGDTDARHVGPIGEALETATAGVPPFRLRLGRLGAFPDLARPRVVWCGVEGAAGELDRLRRAIVSAVQSVAPQPEASPFTPHLTIGRVRRDAHVTERRLVGHVVEHAAPLPEIAWCIDHAVLYESLPSAGGVRHVPLISAPLRGAVSA
jgi:2'-5' RNA ligase